MTEGRLIVNLFGGSAKTTVGIRINGGTVQFAEKVRMPDPAVSLIVQKNKDKIYPTPGNTRLPLREQNSAHIWVLELGATASATELRTVELVAEDDYGYRVHQHYFF